MASSMEKKLTELEMGLLHLQQNIDIPEITLTVHPGPVTHATFSSSPCVLSQLWNLAFSTTTRWKYKVENAKIHHCVLCDKIKITNLPQWATQ